MRLLLLLGLLGAVSAGCRTDKDCPSSYCQNADKGHGSCHLCGDNCCLTDADCPGSYCKNDPTMMPPYFCHGSFAAAAADPVMLALSAQQAGAAPAPAAPPKPDDNLTPAAAADAKAVEDFLKKYDQVVAGVAIAVGFLFAFAGYRYFTATLFVSGAAAAGFVSYVLIDHYMPVVSAHNEFVGAHKPAVLVGVTVSLAIVGGALCACLRKVGTFFAGAAGGASAAVMLNAALLTKLPHVEAVPQLWLYLAVVVLGVLGGALALKIERPVIILASSLAGTLAFVAGIGHFAGHFPTTASSFVNPATHAVSTDPWVWGYAGGYVLMVLAAIVVQFRTTADRKKQAKDERYQNSLLYSAPQQPESREGRVVYVDHVSGYNTAV